MAVLLPTNSLSELFSGTLFFLLLPIQAYLLQFKGTQVWRLALLPFICLSSVRFGLRYTTGAPLLDVIFVGVVSAYAVMKGVEWSFCSSEEYRWMGKEPLSRWASGLDWSWGVPQDRLPATLPQEPGNVVLASLENILWWNGVLFFSMAPLLNMRLYGGTMQGYLQAWGISDVPYLDPIAIAIQGICLGQACFSAIECGNSWWTLQNFLLQSLLHRFGLAPAFDASRWPALFNAPWKSTSLSELWSRRWHAIFFRQFIALGLRPGRRVFSWAGRRASFAFGLICAFFVSGLLHEFAFYAAEAHLGHSFDWHFPNTVFFVSQALGIIAEQMYTYITGYQVRGWLGRIWTFGFFVTIGSRQAAYWIDRGLLEGLPPTTEWHWARFILPLGALLPKQILTT